MFPPTFCSRIDALISLSSDIKARLIDSQADAAGAPAGVADNSIKVNQPAAAQVPSCCS
jgi:Ras-related protein Rab-8A